MKHKTASPLALIAILLMPCAATSAAENRGGDDIDVPVRLDFVFGQSADGSPSERWLHAIRRVNTPDALERHARTTRPFSAGEREWIALIRARAATWPSFVPVLTRPFPDIHPPGYVELVIGNVGGQDAFIDNDRHIAFDVARLGTVYGPADSPGNAERLDRIFRHEFTHLLHKEWRRVHEPAIGTPLEQALWGCLAEGIGNYYSLSARWTTDDGALSAHANEVLARLAPIFVERLALLATADPAAAAPLFEGLSMGPFEQKWGALPVALWLSQEARDGDETLATWIAAGPRGVLDLAAKYLPPELASRLPERP